MKRMLNRLRSSRVWAACEARPWATFLVLFACLYALFLSETGLGYIHTLTMDMPSFYSAAEVYFVRGVSPYLWEELQAHSPHKVHPYLYPPPSLFLFRPLASLTLKQACTAGTIVNNLLVLALVWLIPFRLLKASPARHFTWCLVSVAVVLLSHPTHMAFALGQVNLLLTLFIVGFWILARDERPAAAGLCLTLAIVLKVYPLLILPLLLLLRRFREVVWAAAWMGVAVVLSCLFLSPRLWLDWLQNVMLAGGYGRIVEHLGHPSVISNIGLNGFMSRLWALPPPYDQYLISPAARVLTYAIAVALLVVCGLAVRRIRTPSKADALDRMMLVALSCIFLLGPISWHHHLVYLLSVVVFLPPVRWPWPTRWRVVWVLVTGTAGLFLCSSWGRPLEFHAVLVLFAAAVVLAVRPEGRTLPDHGSP
jgi:hypothetical protein